MDWDFHRFACVVVAKKSYTVKACSLPQGPVHICFVSQVTIFYSSLNSYFPSINGLVTDGNTKLCCQGFILMLFQSITANKIYS